MSNTQKSIYVISKIDSVAYCKTNGQFTKHLRAHNITYQQYHEKYITGIEEQCPHCGTPKVFYQKNHVYGKTCGSEKCIGKEIAITKSNWTESQRISDSLNKKTAMNSRTDEEIRSIAEKRKITNLAIYGVSHSTQSLNNIEKSKKTKLEKYGNEFYSSWDKSAKKNRNKTVDEQTTINDKRRKTNIELFGVSCSFLVPESIKNSRRANALGKEYIMPSGRVVGIRGYEHLVLDELFARGCREEELLIHNKLESYTLPIFDYINENMHAYKYYPDIYIPTENLIIEVKSQWWYDGYGTEKYKGRLINNQRKADSVISAGYKYQIWLFTDPTDTSKFTIIQYD